MVKSMTGFASLTREEAASTLTVTVRSVNHRFLDVQLRLPGPVAPLEPTVRAAVGRHLARGRVEVGISLQHRGGAAVEVSLNEPFVAALGAALDQARARGLVTGALSPGDLLRLPQALAIRERGEGEDPESQQALATLVEDSVGRALADLDVMRVREGEMLRADMAQRVRGLADTIGAVAAAAEAGAEGLKARLADRVRELNQSLSVDAVVLAQEVVKFAARSDISEELTRFRAHLEHWDALTDGIEPCGRKLDFLLQEMNREVNTIGSKADGIGVAELVIAIKAELEKLREQVQNVE